ncbi:ABC transporter ATP-binding protein [Magnetospirillum sp. 15-1]|uniref:ABC transporter ATP-binding protein n=1 Tax=Magnetospirillum sp. 15-1 TaxID=1979370 RepID=UPI0014832CD5|nr:ABC transporter ATP-binding protein [Magnetospirillum sp. 15-1]
MIQLENIVKDYGSGEGRVRVLGGVSLTIAAGEMCAIVGASGSGKTTLLNILGLLDRPSAGRYRLGGIDVAEAGADALADLRNRRIGFVFQAFHLLARQSALDNVAHPLLYRSIGRAERRELAAAELDRVGLGDRFDHRPDQLSGGQRQRVAIARAMVGRPSMILADEPTGNLDSAAAADILDLLDDMNRARGVTVIVVTHDAAVADRCRRRILVRDGSVVTST